MFHGGYARLSAVDKKSKALRRAKVRRRIWSRAPEPDLDGNSGTTKISGGRLLWLDLGLIT